MRALSVLVSVLAALACAASATAAGSQVQPGTLSVAAGVIGGPGSCGAGWPAPGPATATCLGGPTGVAVDPAGDIYIADGVSNLVLKVTPTGLLSTVAGTGTQGTPTPGPATHSDLNNPYAVAVDPAGDLYIADEGNDVVEKVTPAGMLSIVAGTGRQGEPTPGAATASDIGRPVSIAANTAGDLYIADQLNSEVEEVTPDGTLSVVAGTGRSGQPTPGAGTRSQLGSIDSLAVDGAGDLYIANSEPSPLILKLTPSGRLSIVAGLLHPRHVTPGPATPVPATPGPATRTPLGGPVAAVAVDAMGDVYVGDPLNASVEEITPGGVLSVIAGAGATTTPGTDQAQLETLVYPQGIAVSATGDLYIASTQAGVVEQVADAPDSHSSGRPTIVVGPPRLHGLNITTTLSCLSGSAPCAVTATLRAATLGHRTDLLVRRSLTIPVGKTMAMTLAPNRTKSRFLRRYGSTRALLAITPHQSTIITTAVQGILVPAAFHRTFTIKSRTR